MDDKNDAIGGISPGVVPSRQQAAPPSERRPISALGTTPNGASRSGVNALRPSDLIDPLLWLPVRPNSPIDG